MSISYLSTSLPASESQNIQVNNLLVNGNTTVLGSLTASTTIHTNLEVTNSISLTSPFTASVFYFYNGTAGTYTIDLPLPTAANAYQAITIMNTSLVADVDLQLQVTGGSTIYQDGGSTGTYAMPSNVAGVPTATLMCVSVNGEEMSWVVVSHN